MPIDQPLSRDNIKVGYISQFERDISVNLGLTIEEANNYEKMSPGDYICVY